MNNMIYKELILVNYTTITLMSITLKLRNGDVSVPVRRNKTRNQKNNKEK